MPASFTQFLDNLYTTTWQNRLEGVADNVFNATPFWFWMKDKGKLKPQRGGRFIELNLEYAKNANVKWVGRGGTVAMSDYQFLTVAQFNWRYVTASIVRFGVDEQQNAGKAKILDYVNSKLDNTEKSLQDELEARLPALQGVVGSVANTGGLGQATTTASDASAMDGLQSLVADDPTNSGTFGAGSGALVGAGGIDSSLATQTWWRNQFKNMTGLSFATLGVPNLRTMLNNCMQNKQQDRPDIMLSDQTSYERYEANVLTFFRTENRKLADLGFENQTFKGIPWVWSVGVATRVYFLNTNFLWFIYDPALNFDMTEWKPIPDQVNDRVAQIILAGNLCTNRRRVHGVMYNMDTA